jgi:carboxylesterase
MLVLLASVTLAVVLAVALRARRASVLVGRAAGRHPIGPDGIVAGAGPITLSRGADAPGMLLLHGGGDTPQTLRYLAEHLHQRGYAVYAPLLPGHGRSIEDFARVTSGEWRDAARAALREMRERHTWVGVAGLSMGGALAVQVAAETTDLPALVLLAPYLSMPREVAIAARLARFWGIAVPYVRSLDPGARRSINDPEEDARNLAYGVFTPAALRALRATVARAASLLPRVTAPTLMIQSREDNRIAPADAQRAFDHLGATNKQLVWIEGAGHVITVDYGRDRVFELLTEWLDRHRASRSQRVQA